MNEHAILHTPNSKYCFAKDEKTVSIRIRVARGEQLQSLTLIYGSKYTFTDLQNRAQLTCKYTDRLYDYYIADIKLDDVRLLYYFEIKTIAGEFYFFSEDGLTSGFDIDLAYYNAFQLPYINKADVFETIEGTDNLVAYQIFVDRFRIGKENKDKSYINLAVGQKPEHNSFGGGDLLGIAEKLEYIKSLGVNAIYITPIFESITNHKYDITNYYIVDNHFGENNDLKILVNKAHSLGMKIIMDAVFNHSSDEFDKFEDVIVRGKESPYYNWFIINGDKPTKNPCNYERFAFCTNMPKFNTSNEEVQKYLIDIGLYWLREYHIDGWRLDVSDEVSHDFWKKFRLAIKKENPNCLIIGENWHDAYPFLQGDEFDSIMNYVFTKACLDVFAYNASDSDRFCNKLNGILMRNTDTVNGMMLNLLDSHDTARFLTLINENLDKFNAAIATLFFFPGIPCIYYGTELEMTGNGDPDCRKMFDWSKENTETKTKSTIKFMANLKTSGCLKGTNIRIISEKGCIKIMRINENEKYTLVMNIDNDEVTFNSKNIIYSNLYTNNVMQKYGYVVLKENI